MNVSNELQEVDLRLAKNRLETAFKHVPGQSMPPVEILGVAGQKAAREFGKIRQRGLQQQMEVVWHETPREDDHTAVLDGFSQETFELTIIVLVQEDRATAVPSTVDVVGGVFE